MQKLQWVKLSPFFLSSFVFVSILTLAEPDVCELTSFVKWNKALTWFAVPQTISKRLCFLVLIRKNQFINLNLKPREESDSEPALDDPSSHDIQQWADNWFFKVIVRLDNGGHFSEVLNACKQQLECCLSTVSVISWAACPDSGSENSGSQESQQHEGFVHDGSSNQIRMGLLKHVLPEKVLSDAIEIIQATFQEIRPCRGNDYT